MKRTHLLIAVLGLLATPFFGSTALAQCGGIAKHVSYSGQTGAGHFELAAALQAGDGQWGEDRRERGLEPIVGLWKTDFEDPAHHYSDKGYAVWHSDHTEFMNSTRPPSVGAVCEGVWERVGESTYKLNHFALGYGDGVNLTDVYRFIEVVTVDRSGDRFSGHFTIEAFDPKTHASHGTLQGTLTAERVKIDTTIDSQDF